MSWDSLGVWMERGGPVMWPLLLLSVIALAVILERALFWIRERKRPLTEVVGGGHGELELELQRRRLERGMGVLDSAITAAPLLGILGTVLGVIESLEVLADEHPADALAITGGVAEALFTTAGGLVIALAVLFPYNAYRRLARERLVDLEVALTDPREPGGAA